MTDFPVFSIITVCKNSASTIEKTIESVLDQTYPHVEYVIVDGSSTDGTLAKIAPYQPRIQRVIVEPGQGVYPAMNLGIQAATGDFLQFLNADDYLVDPQVLADVAHVIQAHPNCDLIYGDIEVRHPSGRQFINQAPEPGDLLESMIGEGLCHGSCFMRASLFHRFGSYQEEYRICADYDWFIRVLQDNTVTRHHLPRNIISYYQGGLSSDLAATRREMFTIQNLAPLYQQPEWLQRRLLKYQSMLAGYVPELQAAKDWLEGEYHRLTAAVEKAQADWLESQQALHETRQALAQSETALAQSQAEIAAMKSSKFWKLRTYYTGLKGWLIKAK